MNMRKISTAGKGVDGIAKASPWWVQGFDGKRRVLVNLRCLFTSSMHLDPDESA